MSIPNAIVIDIKIWPEFFLGWMTGHKRAEFRKLDRNYRVGDKVRMWEWDPKKKSRPYTGRVINCEIIDIVEVDQVGGLTAAQKKAFQGYGVISMKLVSYGRRDTPPTDAKPAE